MPKSTVSWFRGSEIVSNDLTYGKWIRGFNTLGSTHRFHEVGHFFACGLLYRMIFFSWRFCFNTVRDFVVTFFGWELTTAEFRHDNATAPNHTHMS